MNKGKKCIVLSALILALVSVFSFKTLRTSALTDLDIKYANAYNATMNVESKAKKYGVKPYFKDNNGPSSTDAVLNSVKAGMQKDILAAREALDKLPKDRLDLIGTLSSILDNYQHPVYERAVVVINQAQKNPNQKDINIARHLIENIPSYYKNAYSSALDDVQVSLNKKTEKLIDNALASQSTADITAAKAAIEELKTNEFLSPSLESLIAGYEAKLNDEFVVIGID